MMLVQARTSQSLASLLHHQTHEFVFCGVNSEEPELCRPKRVVRPPEQDALPGWVANG